MLLKRTLLICGLTTTLLSCGDQDGVHKDQDGDNVPDLIDVFPTDSNESKDTDFDGIGNNTDSDDDNDGVEDNIDAFPLDKTEWQDTDNDGIGDNADDDDDNDDVTDAEDAFPLNYLESQDFDGDGLGDNEDGDDDNDGIADESDNIHIVGFKDDYLQGQSVDFKVRGFSQENQRLLDENGWHVQYYLYNAETNQRITSLSAAGYYNANYNIEKHQWSASFPTPSQPFTYRVEVTVYCSLATDDCDGVANNDYIVEHSANITVICPANINCDTSEQPHKAKQLTNKITPQDSPKIVKGDNGDLFVGYRDFDDLNNTQLLTSTDQGVTWNEISNLPVHYPSSLAISKNGSILGLSHCQMSVCLFERELAQDNQGGQTLLTELLADIEVDIDALTDDEGTQYPFSNFLLMETIDGGYIIGFSIRKETVDFYNDLYLIKTYDFINVDTLAKLSRPDVDEGYGNIAVAEGANGTLTVAYSKLTSDYRQSWVIQQGLTLDSLQIIATSDVHYTDIELISVSGQPIAIGNISESLYRLNLDGGELVLGDTLYEGGIQFGFSSVALPNNTLGIVYEADWNEQRDIFMDTIAIPLED